MKRFISNSHLSYSDDFFKTSKIAFEGVNSFTVKFPYLYAEKLVDERQQKIALFVSPLNTTSYKFTKCQFPFPDLGDLNYQILDTSHGQTFVLVNHWSKNSNFGHLYMSDSIGARFSLSLKYVPKTDKDFFDFSKVAGLEGVYLANHYKEELFERGLGATGGNVKESYKQKLTKITFNRGGTWLPVSAPEKDSLGRKVSCEDESCSLHLNVAALTDIGHLYSSKNAIGLLVSTGNVGYKLPTKTGEINTYVSRDSGMTWSELAKGSNIYETGDHGSFLVFGSDQKSSNTISYSIDEGQTVDSLKIASKFEVYDMMSEPSNVASHFLAVGMTSDEQGMTVSMDFSNFFPRMCDPSSTGNTTDYEEWSPHSAHSLSSCVLGRKISITRKKQGAKCFNGEKFDRKKVVENCVCSQEDWECDLGWSRVKEGSCKRSDGSTELDFTKPEKCLVYYTVSQGYRKVTGDSCESGVDLAPLRVPCPGSSGIGDYLGKLFIFLLLTSILLYLYSTGKASDLLSGAIPLVQSFIPSSFNPINGLGSSSNSNSNSNELGGMKAGSLFEDNEDDEEED